MTRFRRLQGRLSNYLDDQGGNRIYCEEENLSGRVYSLLDFINHNPDYRFNPDELSGYLAGICGIEAEAEDELSVPYRGCGDLCCGDLRKREIKLPIELESFKEIGKTAFMVEMAKKMGVEVIDHKISEKEEELNDNKSLG